MKYEGSTQHVRAPYERTFLFFLVLDFPQITKTATTVDKTQLYSKQLFLIERLLQSS